MVKLNYGLQYNMSNNYITAASVTTSSLSATNVGVGGNMTATNVTVTGNLVGGNLTLPGVQSLNLLTGNLTLSAGSNISLTNVGSNIVITGLTGPSTGVTSLNDLSGALTLSAGSNISLAKVGSNIVITGLTGPSTGVSSISAAGTTLNGVVGLVAGTDISITLCGAGFLIASTGAGNASQWASNPALAPVNLCGQPLYNSSTGIVSVSGGLYVRSGLNVSGNTNISGVFTVNGADPAAKWASNSAVTDVDLNGYTIYSSSGDGIVVVDGDLTVTGDLNANLGDITTTYLTVNSNAYIGDGATDPPFGDYALSVSGGLCVSGGNIATSTTVIVTSSSNITIPFGYSNVQIQLWGAGGQDGSDGIGGGGAYIEGILPIGALTSLSVNIGSFMGTAKGSYGGAGGSATYVSANTSLYMIAAAGGGGGGAVNANNPYAAGGAGGINTGVSGSSFEGASPSPGGGGANGITVGPGGFGTPPGNPGTTTNGITVGVGGAGGNVPSSQSGGGGGGGHAGGGGGGAVPSVITGGGGGGSSYFNPIITASGGFPGRGGQAGQASPSGYPNAGDHNHNGLAVLTFLSSTSFSPALTVAGGIQSDALAVSGVNMTVSGTNFDFSGGITQLTVGGVPVGGGGNASQWASNPAVANVNLSGYSIVTTSGSTITLGNNTTVDGNLIVTGVFTPSLVLFSTDASYTVPAGYSSVKIELWGGGGVDRITYFAGGGGYTSGIYSFTGTPTFNISVGSSGGGGQGGSNAGNGGGATYVVLNTSILAIAGGGGGCTGLIGSSPAGTQTGGSGGGPTAGDGIPTQTGGLGGSQTAGGVGGGGDPTLTGLPGLFTTGTTIGNGGAAASPFAGGGGAGYGGGGAGGAFTMNVDPPGGGGGGSSYVDPALTATSLLMAQPGALAGKVCDLSLGAGDHNQNGFAVLTFFPTQNRYSVLDVSGGINSEYLTVSGTKMSVSGTNFDFSGGISQLTTNGVAVGSQWASFPAVSNVNMGGNAISNCSNIHANTNIRIDGSGSATPANVSVNICGGVVCAYDPATTTSNNGAVQLINGGAGGIYGGRIYTDSNTDGMTVVGNNWNTGGGLANLYLLGSSVNIGTVAQNATVNVNGQQLLLYSISSGTITSSGPLPALAKNALVSYRIAGGGGGGGNAVNQIAPFKSSGAGGGGAGSIVTGSFYASAGDQLYANIGGDAGPTSNGSATSLQTPYANMLSIVANGGGAGGSVDTTTGGNAGNGGSGSAGGGGGSPPTGISTGAGTGGVADQASWANGQNGGLNIAGNGGTLTAGIYGGSGEQTGGGGGGGGGVFGGRGGNANSAAAINSGCGGGGATGATQGTTTLGGYGAAGYITYTYTYF